MDQLARTPKQLGAVLRRRRRALEQTQLAIARETGLRQATLSSAEAGGPMPLQTLYALLAALDLEMMIRPRSKAADVSGIF